MKTLSTQSRTRLDVFDIAQSATSSFADDVRATLGQSPKRPVPPKYFYDDLGSALFDAITRLPNYYLCRAETDILHTRSREIVAAFDRSLEFLELGGGSAHKTRLLIEEALRTQGTLRLNAIEISHEALHRSATALVDAFPRLLVRAYAGDYFDVLQSGALQFDPHRAVLALCMGSNIGNYHPGDCQRLCALLAATLRPGDGLLLGTDLKKDAATLERAYDDAGGVMDSFGRNLLTRLNRELGANFDQRDFHLVAHYDEARGSVDSFLQCGRTHDVAIPGGGMTLHFDAGELVHTEWSFKFSPEDVAQLGRRNGFDLRNTWYDESRSYAVHLLVRNSHPSDVQPH